MSDRKLQRTLSWGATRAETISTDDGDITLQTAESADMSKMAETVENFILEHTRRFEIDMGDLRRVLLDDPWLLGYTFGACVACIASSDGTGDTSLVGFASRVCGELLGGGIDRKVAAYDILRRQVGVDDFDRGRTAAIEDWAEQWSR